MRTFIMDHSEFGGMVYLEEINKEGKVVKTFKPKEKIIPGFSADNVSSGGGISGGVFSCISAPRAPERIFKNKEDQTVFVWEKEGITEIVPDFISPSEYEMWDGISEPMIGSDSD